MQTLLRSLHKWRHSAAEQAAVRATLEEQMSPERVHPGGESNGGSRAQRVGGESPTSQVALKKGAHASRTRRSLATSPAASQLGGVQRGPRQLRQPLVRANLQQPPPQQQQPHWQERDQEPASALVTQEQHDQEPALALPAQQQQQRRWQRKQRKQQRQARKEQEGEEASAEGEGENTGNEEDRLEKEGLAQPVGYDLVWRLLQHR
eukprot:1141382-Pelagomonas_calceolata.AAC.5